MREITYHPQPFTDEAGKEHAPKFEGEIKLDLPSYKERIQMVKALNFKTENNKAEVGDNNIDEALKVLDLVEKHVKAVDLVRSADGLEFKSLEDLGYDSDGSELINEIGRVILGGTRLGNG